jgi:hypothetical protein
MNISALMALGNFGLSMFGAFRARSISNRQEEFFNRQADFNMAVGEFNAQVAERSGYENAVTIAEQTREVLGAQIAEFNRRGISIEGSPQFILSKTVNIGRRGAKNAFFDAEVAAYNARQNAANAASQARMNAVQAGSMAMNQTFNIFRTMLSGMNIMRSQSYLQANQSLQQGNPFSPEARSQPVQMMSGGGQNATR